MSRACAALSDFDFSSDDSSNSEEDRKVKCKQDNFTSICLMGKSLRNISDSDVSDDLSPESFSLRVIGLKMLCAIRISCFTSFFVKIRSWILSLKVLFSVIASLRSVHDDMSVKPCDNCTMIMVNYSDLWLLHSHVARLLDSERLELRELKHCSTLLSACMSYPVLRSDL
jgi:hypothetical protein